ncbi:hypothetical protein JX265_002734 [Neoarthrinium moseri]|uniref:ATP-dependent DNA helicase n=2 Tax=Neoarthrinium moseri TaxID=1658444 RepID=A0A9P9WUZ6_9PEZI|nr:hypothetical protein JX265_002734 [Neoarthrinium moseri]
MSKNYLITGACRGIGRGLSRLLLQKGHRVFLLDNNDVEIEQMKHQIPKWLSNLTFSSDAQSRYEILRADMSRKEDIEMAARSASAFFDGSLDVLVNNAANTSGAHGPGLESEDFLAVWENSVQVNLTGSALLSRACLPMLKRQPPRRPHGGNIVMVSSTRAYQSEPNSEAYASTKAGLLGLSHAMACSLADDGIKVNAILPGWINVVHESKEGDEQGMKWEDGLSEDDQRWHFSGRVGKVEDILKAVEYFSDSDSFITGEELKVDGGVTRRMTYPEPASTAELERHYYGSRLHAFEKAIQFKPFSGLSIITHEPVLHFATLLQSERQWRNSLILDIDDLGTSSERLHMLVMSYPYYYEPAVSNGVYASLYAGQQPPQQQWQPATTNPNEYHSPPPLPPSAYEHQNNSDTSAAPSHAAVNDYDSAPVFYPQLPQQPQWQASPYFPTAAAGLPVPTYTPQAAGGQDSNNKRKRREMDHDGSPGLINVVDPNHDMHRGSPSKSLAPIPDSQVSKRYCSAAPQATFQESPIHARDAVRSFPGAALQPVSLMPSVEHVNSGSTASCSRVKVEAENRKMNLAMMSYPAPSSQKPISPPPSQTAPEPLSSPSRAQPSARAAPMPDEPILCAEQAALVDVICSGRNVFYTGSAGCGKSTVLKAFTKRLRAMGKQVRILAPTGRAALQVNGSTTWTYAGWTPDHHKQPLEELKKGAHGKFVYKRLAKETDVIVIDEISMVENLHFERLNELMKEARYKPSREVQPAFGGVQVIVTGDFCQLPPVKPFQHCIDCGRGLSESFYLGSKKYSCTSCRNEWHDQDKWAFRSKAWQECNFEHVHLRQIHRQNDEEFIRMLQKTRVGEALTSFEISRLMEHPCRVNNATRLFATRDQVKEVNQKQFKRLTGVNHWYWSRDVFKWQREYHPHLQWKGLRKAEGPPGEEELKPLKALEDHRFDEQVQLKQGMLVVLLVNLDLAAGLCNGSQGLICGFEPYDPAKMPRARTGKKEEPENLIMGDRAVLKEQQIKAFSESKGTRIKRWPVVRFHNGTTRVIYADCSIAELGDEKPYSLLIRTQIPLAPAWAMTIHKSQSLTLDRVIVNLSRAFEEGQVYVALSRATSLEGLKIEGDSDALTGGLGGNREVQRFLRENFGALNAICSK